MFSRELKKLRLSHCDLDFLVETASPDVTDKANLKRIIQEDVDFRNNYFGLYKRIADICLFMLGVFPEYTMRNYRYPLSGKLRPGGGSSPRINPEEYVKEGRKFYKLAAQHASARDLEMEDVFWVLHENFQNAKKPLNFIAEHYLQYKRQMIFA